MTIIIKRKAFQQVFVKLSGMKISY